MPFDPQGWLQHFVLPLVAGGDVRVATAVGQRELEEVRGAAAERELERIAAARYALTAELLATAKPPLLDEEALRLAAAVQNLLFLSHPGTARLTVTKRRLRALSAWTTRMATLPLPDSAAAPEVLVARHSMVHHLFDLGRDDVRVSFWIGKREFRGAEPPARLLKWPEVRRVREERWRVTVVAEAMAEELMRPIVTALVASSPLTDLLEPLRLEPAFELGRLWRWLRWPEIARAVADRWLTLGLGQIAGTYMTGLVALYSDPGVEARAAARTVTAFACHLQLLTLMGKHATSERDHLIELQAQVQSQPALRDLFGLFAAAQRLGLGRPADADRDPRLMGQIEAYGAACAALVGPDRLYELSTLIGRGT